MHTEENRFLFLPQGVEVDGKLVWNASAGTHARTDGQTENIMPSAAFVGRTEA